MERKRQRERDYREEEPRSDGTAMGAAALAPYSIRRAFQLS